MFLGCTLAACEPHLTWLRSGGNAGLRWQFSARLYHVHTFQVRQAVYCQAVDKLLRAHIQYLHNCCLIIIMKCRANNMYAIEGDIS